MILQKKSHQVLNVDISSNLRLDLFLTSKISHLSRSQIKGLIEAGNISLGKKILKANYKVKKGDQIKVIIPEITSDFLVPQKIDFPIIFENEDLLVIDKPANLTVHPGAGQSQGTLANAILGYLRNKGKGNKIIDHEIMTRGGIVHRLDKETSGLLVVAKNDQTLRFLQKQFQERRVKKSYLALVYGRIEPKEGIIKAPIGRHTVDRKKYVVTEKGKPAETYYKLKREYELKLKSQNSKFKTLSQMEPKSHKFTSKVDQRSGFFSLLEVFPKTGRTHQIRVHLSALGYPVVGDKLYGKRFKTQNSKYSARPKISSAKRNKFKILDRQFLHAVKLGFKLPNGELKEFRSELPSDLKNFLNDLTPIL